MTINSPSRFFPFLAADEEHRLLGASHRRTFASEDLILDQNQAQQSIHLVETGAVRVEREDRGAMIPITVLGAGELFGEMSFVDGLSTSARIVAEEPTTIRIIDAALVAQLARSDPAFEARLYRSLAAILSQRLRLTSMRVYADQSWG